MTGLQVWLHPSSRTKISSRFPVLSSQKNPVSAVLLVLLRTENCSHTLRRFGGRHPLCGIGVASLIERTSIPAAARARTADSRPDPGPLTRTSTVRTPWSRAMLAAFIAACCAANGVPLRDPRKPSDPELFHASTLPLVSEIVTMVLLKEACTCTSPCGTCLRSFFLNVFFLPFFSGAAGAPPAAAGFAIFGVLSSQFSVLSKTVLCCN